MKFSAYSIAASNKNFGGSGSCDNAVIFDGYKVHMVLYKVFACIGNSLTGCGVYQSRRIGAGAFSGADSEHYLGAGGAGECLTV